MAVGDVVAGVASSSLSFQPAAGVEVVLTSYGANKQWSRLTDGTTNAYVFIFSDSSAVGQNTGTGQGSGGAKLCINNSIYLNFTGTSYTDGGYYTGIQIK